MPNDQTGNDKIEDLTIREIFAVSPDRPELAAGIEAKDFQDIQKQISSLAQPIPWSRVQAEVASIIPTLLDTRLLDAWAHGWEKYQGLKDDAEKSRQSPEDVVLSPLAEHSIDSTLHPYIEIMLGPKEIGKIKFNVTLTTQLKGLVLGLKNGNIVSLQLAQCEWTGTIATQGVTLIKRELKKLDLPGRITLKRGIPLGSNNKN
jgi:hypothetical protein